MLTSLYRRMLAILLLVALCAGCTPSAQPIGALPLATAVRPAQPETQSEPAAQAPRPQKTLGSQPGKKPKAAPPTLASQPEITSVNIILGRPTDISIAANLYSAADHAVKWVYRDQNQVEKTIPVDLKARQPQTVTLEGLSADSEYTYHLTVDGQTGSEHHFHTQRAPGSSFTFTIDADPHGGDPNFNGNLYAITLANALAGRPDFHIDLGDTFMTEKLQARSYAEAEATFTALRPSFGILGADAPLFLVNGNHEGELGWLAKGKDSQLPLWSAQLRQMYYPNPLPGGFYSGASSIDPMLNSIRDGYYAWTWGDALFVVLDPFWYTTSKPRAGDPRAGWGWTLGREQYDWLKTTLETSPATFKFVFTHHLAGGAGNEARGGVEVASFYEWGGNNTDGSYGFDQQRPGWGKPIHQLLVDNHVSAVFHGHDHVFVKQELDGIIYQELPQPGTTAYDKTQLAGDYGYHSGLVSGSSGHLQVTVTPGKVTVTYIRAFLPQDEVAGKKNGTVENTYQILP